MMNEEEEGEIEFTKTEIKEELDPYNYSSVETNSFDAGKHLKEEMNDEQDEFAIPNSSRNSPGLGVSNEIETHSMLKRRSKELSSGEVQKSDVNVRENVSNNHHGLLTNLYPKPENFRLKSSKCDDKPSKYTSLESQNDNEPIVLEGGWKRISDEFSDVRPTPLPNIVQEYEGVNPTVGFSQNISVIECVKLFISEEIITHIVTCTNERAEIFFCENPTLNGKINSIKWHDVTVDNMYIFLALYFYTGQCKFSKMSQYWSRNPYEPGIHFFCSSIMSRDRYMSIMKFLRFTSVKNVKQGCPSTELDSFCDKVKIPMMKNVDAGQHIAIGEALVVCKGQLEFRQLIKENRSDFGIKMFVMCNSDRDWSGYCYNFSVYYGKESNTQYILPDVEGVNDLSSNDKLIIHLSNSVLGQGRHIFLDNWYSSTQLANFLLTQETLITGTIHTNRGVPAEVQREKLNLHESVFVRKENTLIAKWQDKREVYVLTTKYASQFTKKDKTVFGGSRVAYKKPLVIEKYNKFMGSVDKVDQMLEPLEPSRKSMAWFKKLGLHLLMRFILNSFIVYKNTVDKKCVFKNFILQTVEQLIETHSPNGISVREKFHTNNPRSSCKRKLEEEITHAFVPLQSSPGSTNKPRKRCRVCYPALNKLTRMVCDGCSEKPGLCSIEHFNEWHKRGGGGTCSSMSN